LVDENLKVSFEKFSYDIFVHYFCLSEEILAQTKNNVGTKLSFGSIFT